MFHSRFFRFPGLCLLALIVLIAFVLGLPTIKAQTPATQPLSLSLRLAVLLDKGPTTLAFTATNTGKTNIETSPLTTNSNIVVVMRPNGSKVEIFVSKDWPRPPVTIRPGQSKTWSIDIGSLMESWGLHEKGIYRVSWSLEGVRSQEVLLLKSK